MKWCKQTISLLCLALLLSNTGCKQIDKLTQFDYVLESECTIPGSFGVQTPFTLFTPEMQTNYESVFESENTRKDLVEEIRLEKVTLTLKNPSGADFDFLNNIYVYLKDASGNEREIAHKDPVPADGSQVLEMDTEPGDIKDLLMQDKVTIKISTTTDEVITQDHVIGIRSVFFVDAKIPGQ
ncbi:MAG: hypothetical protein IBJ09_06585 [Bacteroidia bacterium]|nr:hypothetical protein [Bacteroidia bacterium]